MQSERKSSLDSNNQSVRHAFIFINKFSISVPVGFLPITREKSKPRKTYFPAMLHDYRNTVRICQVENEIQHLEICANAFSVLDFIPRKLLIVSNRYSEAEAFMSV